MVARWSDKQLQDIRNAIQGFELPYFVRWFGADPELFEELSTEDFRCEYLNGDVIVHSPATFDHENRSAFLSSLLRMFAAKHNLGLVLSSNIVMQIGERRLCPDVSFLAAAHHDRVQDDRVRGPMDLVIEVLSKSTRSYDLGEKRTCYREAAVPEIWFVDLAKRELVIDALTTTGGAEHREYETRVLTRGRWNSLALSGFWINAEWLWLEPLPNDFDCLTQILASS